MNHQEIPYGFGDELTLSRQHRVLEAGLPLLLRLRHERRAERARPAGVAGLRGRGRRGALRREFVGVTANFRRDHFE